MTNISNIAQFLLVPTYDDEKAITMKTLLAIMASLMPDIASAKGPMVATGIRRTLQDDPTPAPTPICQTHQLNFIMVDGDANLMTVEDDIRADLAVLGFNVTTLKLSKEDFNAAHLSGEFHLSFTETWGAPYDPHAYASGWLAGDEGHKQAMTNLEPPMSRDLLFDKIDSVLLETNHKDREAMWYDIHVAVHQQAVMLPLWGKRIPTVLHSRFTGYEAGLQQFDYPVQRLQILSGPATATIAPGAQTGLFQSVGRLDPHSYRPNEFFANNWVYESLVNYGPQGQILPGLAASWTSTAGASGSNEQVYTFVLRPNVTFHDGSDWNCDAAKMNLDHVLAPPLTTVDYHGWYGVPNHVKSWSCPSSYELEIVLSSVYAPFLQELSFIRPLRMLSPAAFHPDGPVAGNSCPVAWGAVGMDDDAVTCAGILNISGTGPFVFESRVSSNVTGEDGELTEVDDEVVFVRNEQYWRGAPSIERLVLVRYPDSASVKAALLDGTLDMVWGDGVLAAQDIADLKDAADAGDEALSVFHTADIQNVLLLLNSGKPPLDDLRVRKTIMHAIDKEYIIDNELGGSSGLLRPVDNVFPLNAPYSDVHLTPRWDYDLEKAIFLNCNNSSDDSNSSSDDSNRALALGLGIGLGLLCVLLLGAAMLFYGRSKKYEQELESLQLKAGATSS